MPRDLDLTFDISTGALTLDRVVGNYVKRSETLTLSVTIVSNGASATIPAGLVGTLKPVNTYGTTLAQWTTFAQVGATNVYTASTTINAAAVSTLLGTTTEQANCVFDFAGAGVVESDTLALVLKNNVTRDDDTAPTALLNRNDFLVSNGTGLLVNVAAGYAANGAFVAAQASLAITNATNYIEVTAAGVASVNTTAFTAGSYPLATVVASAGAITANTDLRAWITPKPAPSTVSDGDKGDITVSNSGATWTIDNDTVTLAKLAHMPTARVVGRTTAGTGTPELLTISGTGSVAMTTSPTFVTPDLGTPSALVGTNISGTAASLTAGLVSSIGSLTGDVTSSNRATTLATVNANVGSFTNASLTVNAKGLVTAASSGTAAVTSITGTANEITVTGTTTPTLSLPSAITFTGKTVTGGTFNSGAFNGTVGATTPSTVAGTTGTFSGKVSTTGALASIYTQGTDASIYTQGALAYISTQGALASISTQGSSASISTQGSNASIFTGGEEATIFTLSANASIFTQGSNASIFTQGTDAYISTDGASAHIYTAGANAYIQTRSTFKLNSGSFITTLSHAPTADRAIAFPNAAGTLALVSGDLGTPSALVGTNITGTAASLTAGNVTTIPALSGAITNTGNATVLGSFTMAQLSTAVSDGDPAYVGAANTFTAANNFSNTTSATTSTTGALTIGNGTAATNVGIGGGKINAGSTITAGGTSGTYGAFIGTAGSFSYNTANCFPTLGIGTTQYAGVYVSSSGVGLYASNIRGVLMDTSGSSANLGERISAASNTLEIANFFMASGGTITGKTGWSGTSAGGAISMLGGGGFGANQAGGALTLAGGYSTGTGIGGSILFRTVPAGGAGSSANAAVTALTIDSTQAATFSGTLAVTGASTFTGLLTANGGITLGDAQNIAFNTTTGTKIGAATTQKLSFWNATPIVQPTTAVASATVASPGGGTNMKTDDTFDGYTIAQVVKALRNAGLLA